jgi:hypothetical protein
MLGYPSKSRGGNSMITIQIESETATFEVQGWDKLWSLRSRLEIPLCNIKGAHVDQTPAMGWFQGLKLIGADFPNLFRAGTFYQEGELVFWDVRHPEQTIVIELSHEHFQKLIVEVSDPHASVEMINNAIREKAEQPSDSRE